jgi:DNA-binding transcriptional LysR family regulator
MISDYDLFRRIVATGSLSAAGRELHLSPGMVSKRLARLEARLGTPLIHRTTRKMATTEVGQLFYEDVIGIMAQIASAEARVAGLAERPSGCLRVAAPNSFGRLHIAPHLGNFLKEYPNVLVELLLDDTFADLMDQKVDVAIRITTPPDAGFSAELLALNRRILCAAPSYLAAFGSPGKLEDLERHHLLTASHQSPWRLEGANKSEILEIKSRIVTNCSDVVREAAVAGLGIALRSTWDISREMREGKLVRILPEWRGASNVGIYAVWPRAALAHVNVRALVAFMKYLYGPSPYWESGDIMQNSISAGSVKIKRHKAGARRSTRASR